MKKPFRALAIANQPDFDEVESLGNSYRIGPFPSLVHDAFEYHQAIFPLA